MRPGGLIVAAPASGSGKTLLTLGLVRHLVRRGLSVAAAKAGPDYLDPTFHAAASGRACLNLDLWAMREATLASLVGGLEEGADIVLCEGAMGLFDGAGADGEAGSTASLARALGWPVILVVDARGQGASIAALLRGFALHGEGVPLAGVVFNRVAGERHAALLASAVARHLPLLACLGALPADPALAMPSRHLGLVAAGEIADAEALCERAAAQVGRFLDIDRLIGLARPAALPPAAAASPPVPALGGRIAVARDAAFAFLYPAILEGWRRQGAALAFFSPLAGEPPDPSADAVFLPGGYPELHAGWLAAAHAFLAGLRRAAGEGKPVYGECGGYMVLGESLIDADGRAHPMAGLLPLATSFAEKKRLLGYREVGLTQAGPLGPRGAVYRGHEFHYAAVVREKGADSLFRASDAAGRGLGPAGLRRGNVAGSFVHLIDRR
ncbi:MAG TPA: cobyrinate a,c-diamide synthase [Stellaceae bacterium]|nr:cobyrinate a,c-diamide synthase [Stellaceae bacterium]